MGILLLCGAGLNHLIAVSEMDADELATTLYLITVLGQVIEPALIPDKLDPQLNL